MARYFFDLSDGSRVKDDYGVELADDAAAEVEAVRFLGDVLKHEPDRLRDGTLQVDVRHQRGAIPLCITVGIIRRW